MIEWIITIIMIELIFGFLIWVDIDIPFIAAKGLGIVGGFILTGALYLIPLELIKMKYELNVVNSNLLLLKVYVCVCAFIGVNYLVYKFVFKR